MQKKIRTQIQGQYTGTHTNTPVCLSPFSSHNIKNILNPVKLYYLTWRQTPFKLDFKSYHVTYALSEYGNIHMLTSFGFILLP